MNDIVDRHHGAKKVTITRHRGAACRLIFNPLPGRVSSGSSAPLTGCGIPSKNMFSILTGSSNQLRSESSTAAAIFIACFYICTVRVDKQRWFIAEGRARGRDTFKIPGGLASNLNLYHANAHIGPTAQLCLRWSIE